MAGTEGGCAPAFPLDASVARLLALKDRPMSIVANRCDLIAKRFPVAHDVGPPGLVMPEAPPLRHAPPAPRPLALACLDLAGADELGEGGARPAIGLPSVAEPIRALTVGEHGADDRCERAWRARRGQRREHGRREPRGGCRLRL
ncbi:hypothetical protein K0U83_10810, partial [bacterium]|nr:hypothetical protein [bacterium]